MMLNQGGQASASPAPRSSRSSVSSLPTSSSPHDFSSNLTLSSNRNSTRSRSNSSSTLGLAEMFPEASNQEILTLCESLGLLGLGGACREAGQSTNTYGGSFDAGGMLGQGGGLGNYALSSFMSGPSTAGEPSSSSSSSSKPPRCPLPARMHTLYKTELCRGWLETGACRYGTKCQFAHGREELRAVPRHPKYKTELCRSYASSGFCAYGARCRFIHSRPNPLPSPSFPGFDWTSVLSSSASSPGRLNFLGDSPAQSPLSTAHSSSIDQEAVNRLLGIPGWPTQPLGTSAAAASAEAARMLGLQGTPPRNRAPGTAVATPRGSNESSSSSELPSPTSGVAASILSQVRAMAAAGQPPYASADRSSEGSSDPWHSPSPIHAAVSSPFQNSLHTIASCFPPTSGAASETLPPHFPGFNTTTDSNVQSPVTTFEQRTGLQALLSALQRTVPQQQQQQQQQQEQQQQEQEPATSSVRAHSIWSTSFKAESPVMNTSNSSESLCHESLDSALCQESLGGPAE